jgi:acetyltransferase
VIPYFVNLPELPSWCQMSARNRGLGIELLRRIVQIARDENLSSVSAKMLRGNFTVQRVFKKVGFCLRGLADSSSISAVLDL